MAEVQKSQELRRRTGPGSTLEETAVGGNAGNMNGANNVKYSQNSNNNNNNNSSSRGQYAGSSSSSNNNNNNNNNSNNNNTNGNNYHSSQGGRPGVRSMGGPMSGTGSGSGSGSGNYYQQMQLQKPIARLDNNTRMQGAEKVEKAISQVSVPVNFPPR